MKNAVGFNGGRDRDITWKSRGKQGPKITYTRGMHLYATIIQTGQC